jgi:hypothetical protein
MSQLLSLGAINKVTGEYVYPKIANKNDDYICLQCDKDLILCQGEIRVHHFRHKVDNINHCHRYSNPTETQIHKDAKILLKSLLEKKIPISFIRKCVTCKEDIIFNEIPEMSDESFINLEYRFEFNGPKIADIAYIDNGEILCIFEICNTHKTCSENRPEPWFEIDAETLIRRANDNNNLSQIQIPCIRSDKCEDCIKKEYDNLKIINIEQYIRTKLGQNYPPTYDDSGHIIHLRLDFDARDNYEDNKYIINLFKNDFYGKNVVFHSCKSTAAAYIINDIDFKKYNYWEKYTLCNGDGEGLMYEEVIDFTNDRTTGVIMQLIKKCETKYGKIEKIKKEIEECKKSFNKVDLDWMYEDNRSQKKQLKRLYDELNFVENNNGSTLKYVLTTKSKSQRINALSKYLQSKNIGELNELDEHYFTQIYHRFYSGQSGRPKYNVDEIQKVIIENSYYGSKCFNILVDNIKYTLKIKNFN